MLIDWTDEFDRWFTRLEERVDAGDDEARKIYALVRFQLTLLQDLDGPPPQESKMLKEVRQSKQYPVWRLSHPYREGLAVRTIVWFADDDTAVVALFANNKAQMGDIFYSSVGSRADQAIENYLRRIQTDQTHDDQEGDES